MENERDEPGPLESQLREIMWGGKTDAELRDSLQHIAPNSDGALVVHEELARRAALRPVSKVGWLARLLGR